MIRISKKFLVEIVTNVELIICPWSKCILEQSIVNKSIIKFIGDKLSEDYKEHGSLKRCGSAFMTTEYKPIKNVSHVLVSMYGNFNCENELSRSYDIALEIMKSKAFTSICIPLIGTDVDGSPASVSGRILIDSIKRELSNNAYIKEVIIYCKNNNDYKEM